MATDPYEIFVSYCWADNTEVELVDEEKKKLTWVGHFSRELSALIRLFRGRKTAVWRDATDMRGNFQLSTDVYDALGRSTMLIPVLSRSYIRSDWCPEELERFRSRALGEPALGEWQRRVFRVFRTPVAREELPPGFTDGKLYEFFLRRSDAALDVIPFEPDPATPHAAAYRQLLTELAKDITQALDAKPPPQRGIVYLASPAPDLQFRYIGLRTELKDRGYEVLPREALPSDAEEFRRVVGELLDQADCCIFPVGNEPMPALGGAQVQACETEFQVALEKCDPVKLPLLAWCPANPEAPSSNFAKELIAGTLTRQGLEFRRTEFPRLKAELRDWLAAQETRRDAAKAGTKNTAPVFVLHDLCDDAHPVLAAMEEWLRQAGGTFAKSEFSGEPAQLRQREAARLAAATTVILFSGDSSEGWMAAKQASLIANPGPPKRKIGYCFSGDGRPFKGALADALGSAVITPGGVFDSVAAGAWWDSLR
ncbi:MAG TPA: toll/interleukin-1 receptor domain-containing protein [Chthoniobacterales bacterium]|nr:toll/interleukin-1 receptor domain-containing protein [Chthoniobacterales bacterium]